MQGCDSSHMASLRRLREFSLCARSSRRYSVQVDMDKPDRATQIGRALGRAMRAARPQAERLADDMKPRLKKASQTTIAFARDHEPEIRDVTAKVVRSRIPGPLGFVADALTRRPDQPRPDQLKCADCSGVNSGNAKFCNQCGSRLQDSPVITDQTL